MWRFVFFSTQVGLYWETYYRCLFFGYILHQSGTWMPTHVPYRGNVKGLRETNIQIGVQLAHFETYENRPPPTGTQGTGVRRNCFPARSLTVGTEKPLERSARFPCDAEQTVAQPPNRVSYKSNNSNIYKNMEKLHAPLKRLYGTNYPSQRHCLVFFCFYLRVIGFF